MNISDQDENIHTTGVGRLMRFDNWHCNGVPRSFCLLAMMGKEKFVPSQV